jgi:hypothetical protein
MRHARIRIALQCATESDRQFTQTHRHGVSLGKRCEVDYPELSTIQLVERRGSQPR